MKVFLHLLVLGLPGTGSMNIVISCSDIIFDVTQKAIYVLLLQDLRGGNIVNYLYSFD